ncbi:hypothetical protein [Flavobacterium pectinovorum]|uniref:hypothetical protein n=1 Tax=Flavobacterium pectinovorum TaxID=29533 RepID=UPI001FABA4DB|nr:hypothetical protein [Flavobacterium pectinovorum]MCI9843698.1 hypothetical protein [Flavobacterium pectinovorum]
MKKYILLFIFTFQIVFSQKAIIKGNVQNTGTYSDRTVSIIVNDTINKLIKYNALQYKTVKANAIKNKTDFKYDYHKTDANVNQLHSNKSYSTQTDSLGNFEIRANLTDSLFFESYAHITQKYAVADLVKKKNLNLKLKLEPCEVWPEHPEKPTKLYVFVGKKIKAWNSPPGHCNLPSDSRTLAKYEVVKNIYGDYPKDTIQFTSYAHSAPLPQNYSPFKSSFLEYDYSLLYVLQYKDELIQVKYLFDDVYMTKEGRWASPLKPKNLFHTITPDSVNQPELLNFVDPIEFTYDERFEKQIIENFPEPYFKIDNGKIFVTHGFYVEDLFRIRKTGRLKGFDYLIR